MEQAELTAESRAKLNGAIEEGAIILPAFSAYFCQDVPEGLFGPNQLRYSWSL